MTCRYSVMRKYDIANGEGIRASVFVSGCRNHCPDCFNKETWDFNYGDLLTDEVIKTFIDSLDSHIQGLSVLGGDPFEPENQGEVLKLIRQFKSRFPEKDIWVWTGYLLEDLAGGLNKTNYTNDLLHSIDVLIDGKFDRSLYDPELRFRGSSNQRVIDLKDYFGGM